jgi:hypothetical protein
MQTLILEIGPKGGDGYPFDMYRLEGSPPRKVLVVGGKKLPADVLARMAEVSPLPAAGSRALGPANPAGGPDKFEQHAEWLHGLVFRDGVENEWIKARPRRLVLNIVPAELRRLRWEMMRSGPLKPAMNPDGSIVRGALNLEYRETCSDGPIRVLVVVGSAPNDPSVLAEEELSEHCLAFTARESEICLRILDRGAFERETKGEARSLIQSVMSTFQPHIFHYIGHGKLDAGGEPYLLLYDPRAAGGPDVHWTLADILNDLGTFPPKFLFFNACDTVGEARNDDGWSIADLVLDELRCNAVLGMHGAIRGATAGRLSGALYRAFIDGKSLDLALSSARGAADVLKGNSLPREWDWALPYLRFRVLPEDVLPVKFLPPIFKAKIKNNGKFKENKYFVDRDPQRLEFRAQVAADAPRPCNVVLVRGRQEIGKTRLTCFCLEAAALSGRLLKYVDLSSPTALHWRDVLEKIRGGDAGSAINRPLPDHLFSDFHPTLDPNGPEDQVDRIYKAFREALWKAPGAIRTIRVEELDAAGDHTAAQQAARDRRPFLLILDHITSAPAPKLGRENGGIVPGLFGTSLVDGLIKPIASRPENDLLLVLIVREDEERDLGINLLETVPSTLTVDVLPIDQFEALAAEYAQRRAIDEFPEADRLSSDEWNSQIQSRCILLKKKSPRAWSPREMGRLFEEVKACFRE